MKNTINPVKISLSAFAIARYGKEELYSIASREYMQEHEININIEEMKLVPVSIEDDEVIYEVELVDYKIN